jgi:hypothetical protein
MKTLTFKTFVIIIAAAFLLTAFSPVSTAHADTLSDQVFLPTLIDFSASVNNSNANQITGVYVQNLMALPVVQQPSGQAGYVSTSADTLTQFAAASKYGTTGLLAHNYLAGANFFNLSRGSIITIVYGDGHTKYFSVSAIKQYQALSPSSPYSQFINLSNPGVTLSSNDLFYETYGLGNVLILQTCIAKGNESSWGRLFVIAEPIEYLPSLPVTNSIAESNLLAEF